MKVLRFLKSVGLDLLKTTVGLILLILSLGLFSKLMMVIMDFIPADIIVGTVLLGILLLFIGIVITDLVKYLKRKWNEVK